MQPYVSPTVKRLSAASMAAPERWILVFFNDRDDIIRETPMSTLNSAIEMCWRAPYHLGNSEIVDKSPRTLQEVLQ
jgi:hypothetical protein